jgi:serine/threonine protein kinase
MEEGRLHIQTELCTSTLQAELEVPSTHQMIEFEAPALPQRKPMSHERRYKLLREILLALELIHKNNMCHLDIKPENIFIKTDQYKLGVSIDADIQDQFFMMLFSTVINLKSYVASFSPPFTRRTSAS